MAQEFSLAHLTVLGCAPPEMTYIAARAGYDYVSIRPIYMGLPGEPNYALAENREMLKQTKTALAPAGTAGGAAKCSCAIVVAPLNRRSKRGGPSFPASRCP